MKSAIVLLALLSPVIAMAQTSQPMTEKLCEQQGKSYIEEKNKEESVPEPGRSFYWSFVAAHYEAHTNTCYIKYNRFAKGLGTTLEQIKVDDSEGNHIAAFSATWTSARNGYPTYTKPSECDVNGTSCGSKEEFETLLGYLVPSFRRKAPLARGPVPA